MEKAFAITFLIAFFSTVAGFTQPAINLNEHDQGQYIGKQISYFEDKENKLTIREISNPGIKFIFRDADVPTHRGPNPLWVKIIVNNNKPVNDSWILHFNLSNVDHVDLFYQDSSGLWKYKQSGDLIPFNSREILVRTIAFQLPLHEGLNTFFLKVKYPGAYPIPIKLMQNRRFLRENLKAEVLLGIYIGFVIVMFFYNLFIYFSTRDKGYLYYVLWIFSAGIVFASWKGYFYQYFFFSSPKWINLPSQIATGFMIISLALFVKQFLQIKTYLPAFTKYFNVSILVGTLIIPLTFFVNFFVLGAIASLFIIYTCVIALIAGIRGYLKGIKAARFFIISWSVYLVGLAIAVFNIFGLIPITDFSYNFSVFGSAVSYLLLSFALADKINEYRLEKEQAQIEIITMREKEAVILEQKVKDRTRELELVNKDLEAFSYSASHDLRAPLRSILGFAKILEKSTADILNEDNKNSLKVIQKSALGMDKLIQDLLSLSHSSKKELAKEEINMKALIEEVIADSKSIQKPEQIIEYKIGNIEDIFGDRILLKQVWVNLISNAIKYSGKKSKSEIEISSTTSDKEVTYWIKDNGVGFNMDYANKLFGVFQRLHGQSEFEGTGLGLSLVKRIIERHGGKISAESKEGEGATFYFTIPNIKAMG